MLPRHTYNMGEKGCLIGLIGRMFRMSDKKEMKRNANSPSVLPEL
jgi:hypothetical protein